MGWGSGGVVAGQEAPANGKGWRWQVIMLTRVLSGIASHVINILSAISATFRLNRRELQEILRPFTGRVHL